MMEKAVDVKMTCAAKKVKLCARLQARRPAG